MASNSYGFDFLKSEHVLSSNHNTGSNSQYESYHSNNPTMVSQPSSSSSTADDDNINQPNGALPMDDESFRHREMLAVNKPALEKQFDILAFLQKHTRGSSSSSNNSSSSNSSSSSPSYNQHSHHTKCLPPNIIYRATGIDIQSDTTVHTMLQNNPKIIIEYIPDPENPTLLIPHYGYQAKHPNVVDRLSLISQINRTNQGIPMIRDLYDCYVGIEKDIASCICSGDIIAIANNDDRDKILFPRGDLFLTELDGIITIPEVVHPEMNVTTSTQSNDLLLNGNGNMSSKGKMNDQGGPTQKVMMKEIYIVDTDIDPRKQIRRGEAIQVGGQWFRLSSAVKAGVPLSEQPVRAQAPLSVVSHQDLSSRNEVDGYIRPFTAKKVPLDDTLSQAAQTNLLAAKAARETLTKLAHSMGSGSGTAGGASGSGGGGSRHNNTHSTIGIVNQLTGSYASATNPTTLAASLSSTTTQQHHHHTSSGIHQRKRPTSNVSSLSYHNNPQQQQQQQQQRLNSASIVSTKVALEKAAQDPALALYNHARRHGCTKDIRDMYFATRKYVPESDQELNKLLVEYKLLEPNEVMRRPRLMNIKSLSQSISSNLDNDGKPKKRRYYERKNQRMTNTHLEGTEIGALLALAAEKQKQGKSVGDGGM
jgi:hypothetical protein